MLLCLNYSYYIEYLTRWLSYYRQFIQIDIQEQQLLAFTKLHVLNFGFSVALTLTLHTLLFLLFIEMGTFQESDRS